MGITGLPIAVATQAGPVPLKDLGAHCPAKADRGSQHFSILVIDENQADLKNLRLAVKCMRFSEQVTVHYAEACEAALDHLAQPDSALPSLIVLDLDRSGKPCLKALERLKQNQRTRGIPVIGWVSSAHDGVDNAYRAQANCVVCKPTTVEEAEQFLRRIERFWFSAATLRSSF